MRLCACVPRSRLSPCLPVFPPLLRDWSLLYGQIPGRQAASFHCIRPVLPLRPERVSYICCHRRTGEFYIFKAKAVVMSVARPHDIWILDTEKKGFGNMNEPNNTCEGLDMMWRAGAELTMMESSSIHLQTGGFGCIPYSTGNSHNTWFACTHVDAEGREIPWVDRNGRVLETVGERHHAAPGQRP